MNTPALPSFQSVPFTDDAALEHWLAPIRFRNSNTARSYETEVNRFRIFLNWRYPDQSINALISMATELDAMLYECALGDQIDTSGNPMTIEVPQEILRHFNRKSQPFAIGKQYLAIQSDSTLAQQDAASRAEPTRLLKESSINQAMRILHGLYTFLSHPSAAWASPYVRSNPITRVKKSKARVIEQTQRFVPLEAIRAIRTYVEETEAQLMALPSSDPKRKGLAQYQRMRWIFALMFGLWARRSEISSLRMTDFEHDYQGWFVTLQRKGGTTDRIPAPQWLIDELIRYRTTLGLAKTPAAHEKMMAVMRLKNDRGITAQSIYLDVKEMAKKTAIQIEAEHLLPGINPDLRTKYVRDLLKFSPHWFRHSAASMAINTNAMSLQLASERLAHKSTNTTSQMYFHGDQEQQRQGIESMGDAVYGEKQEPQD
jgi:integrase